LFWRGRDRKKILKSKEKYFDSVCPVIAYKVDEGRNLATLFLQDLLPSLQKENDISNMIIEAKNIYSMEFLDGWSILKQKMMLFSMGMVLHYKIYLIRFEVYFCTIMHRVKPSLKEGMQSWLGAL
jgi:hypothetical protein